MNEEISKLPKEEADRVLELPNSYREQGIAEGIREGIKEGIELAKRIVVFNMLKKGMSHELIIEIAELNASEFEKMKKELEDNNA